MNTAMTKSQEDDHSAPSSEQVEKAEHGGTLPLDVNYNTHAVKGDDSDGIVDWTWRHAIASISLAGLYVGMFTLPIPRNNLHVHAQKAPRFRFTLWVAPSPTS